MNPTKTRQFFKDTFGVDSENVNSNIMAHRLIHYLGMPSANTPLFLSFSAARTGYLPAKV